MNINHRLISLLVILLIVWPIQNLLAQEIKWLRVTDLQSFVNEIGAEYEVESTAGNGNMFSWPAQFGIDQNTVRMRGLWIGCKDFNDPIEKKMKGVKVIGSGPRNATDRINQIFEKSIQLVGKNYHPAVIVDDQKATLLDNYDLLDSLDDKMDADRMVVVKFNTSMGISVTKKVSVFTNQNHGSYYINDYTFTNTGIYNRNGDVFKQTLKDLWFYFMYRYAFAGETSSGFGSTWGAFSSTWGNSTINEAFGNNPAAPEFNDPLSPLYKMRGFYSWYGPNKDRAVSYAEDWGCPNEKDDGVLGSAKYAGCVTLYADASAKNKVDDPAQPKTTWFIGSDINIMLANVSQYDEVFMADRYAAMTEGHSPKPHSAYVGEDYPINYTDPRRQTGGGTSQGQGFGPYVLEYGESIRIVFAEAVTGLERNKNREIGGNWLQWRNGTGTPALKLPTGSSTTDYNLYKRKWAETGKDSVLKLYRNAMNNFKLGYKIPSPPPPPKQFVVTSGGDRIQLTWADNAASAPHFNGYVIYRSVGNVLDPKTKYEKIFECNKSNVVHSYNDMTAVRGFDYYYYIQSKDDGTQNDVKPGQPLYSSMFWTVTSTPATLQRPAVSTTLDSVRVVPNPYDIRARLYQYGDKSQYDRIAFYGLPPVCKLKIFTERGDLIWEKDHTRGTGDELWDSTTSSGQIIASGIYILYVEAPDGRKVFRKFVVIR